MATPGVGEDIEDMCTRCGDTWHVVMAKVGERVAKVVCKLCGGQHNYRGEGNSLPAPANGAAGGGFNGARRRRPSRKRASGAQTPPPAPVFDPNKPPRPYSPREAFLPGERVLHPSFGTGVVSGVPGPGKVDVVFPSGARTLACAKTESTLSRPIAVTGAPIADRPPDKS